MQRQDASASQHFGSAAAAPERVADVAAWLVDGARSAAASQDVLAELCERLVASGLPLYRVAVFVQTLHPNIMARRFLWRPGEAATVDEAPFAFADDAAFRTSPIVHIRATGAPIRRRLADPDCPTDFPILEELRADAVTDYLALPLSFTNGEAHVATFTTRAAGGFTAAETADLESIAPALARVAEVRALRRTAVNLLDAYVGHDAGEKILSGKIRRGDSETIRAAIWLSDMRGFTRLVDRLPAASVIERLNAFFDCLAPAIEAEGGDVLKFMGDGLLAIFRTHEPGGEVEACGRALAAAVAARAKIEVLNAELQASPAGPLRFGLALHFGEALYGNIGGGSRLDFTCIGPSINLAARIEKVAAKLGRTVVASAAFAERLAGCFAPLGAFELAGFQASQALFGLPDEGG